MLVAVDLGGTSLRCAAFHDNEPIDAVRYRTPTVFEGFSTEEVWNAIASTVASFVDTVTARHDSVDEVAIAFPGPVAGIHRPLWAPTVSGGTPASDVGAIFAKYLRHPAFFINDVSAAAWYLSTILTAERFLVVTISSGIGSKLFARNCGVVDDQTFAGEIGHIVTDTRPDAMPCDCGGLGHLSTIASGRGFERLARATAQERPREFRRSTANAPGTIAASLSNECDLVPALRAGDEWAWGVLRPGIDALARILVPIIYAAAVEHVAIIGGFPCAIGSRYAEELRRCVRRYAPDGAFSAPIEDLFRLAPLDENACLRGAAHAARQLRIPR